jgi:putative Holliday junction resolvase
VIYSNNMIYLGIDYGKKYIGLACSDQGGTMAFPMHVLKNNKTVINIIEKICADKEIDQIIIGDSVDQKGDKNDIAKDAQKFGDSLKEKLSLPVSYEKEQFTSAHARHGGSEQKGRIDASAAALILQRFLERNNK